MTRPDWCDEQTWAEAAFLTLYPEVDEDGRAYLPADDRETIARALLSAKEEARKEERERCAKLALRWACSEDELAELGQFGSGLNAAAKDIAAAIRKGGGE